MTWGQDISSSSRSTAKSQSRELSASAMKPSSVVAVKYWTLGPGGSGSIAGTSTAFTARSPVLRGEPERLAGGLALVVDDHRRAATAPGIAADLGELRPRHPLPLGAEAARPPLRGP